MREGVCLICNLQEEMRKKVSSLKVTVSQVSARVIIAESDVRETSASAIEARGMKWDVIRYKP